MNTEDLSVELPQYRCHKKVWALKIAGVEPDKTDLTVMWLQFVDCPPYDPREVSVAWVEKHEPVAGGYWVQYADGYEAWLPAETFESGYTRIN